MAQKPSPIPKKPMGVHAPLSLAQQRLWFLYQLDPESPEYNISRAWRLKGSLNTKALVTSLNLILDHHEALRTNFQEIDGQPFQVVRPTLMAPFQERDWSSYSPSQLEAEIERFLIHEPLQAFDLLIGPLLRFNLIRCGPDDHVFIFTVHHMVFDGTSLKNFCEELSLCYQATLNGHPIPLAPLPIQYQDFAYWQQHLDDDQFMPHLEYWQQQLHGAPLVLELPSDLTRPIEPTGKGHMQVFTIPPSVLVRLKELIQPRGVTMFMGLLAIFQILLARYTGQRDLLVGAPMAGRTHTDVESLMGFFVNRLVLRGRFQGETTFHDVLEQVRKTCLEAYSHQALPFEKLVEALQPNRDSGRYPVVQFIFQFRQASDLHLSFPKLLSQPFPVTKQTGTFDLHLVCEETELGIDGFLYYPQDLFSDSMMANFARHYQILLQELLANPQRPVWQVPILTEAECHQQLIDWNATQQDYQKASCIHQLFEAQVARTPKAVAVVCEDQQLTYTELNGRANQVAHYLQRHGVGPETRVGLCLDRSIEMIIAMLGILKAGGAYVPLDPNYPPERLAFQIADAGCFLVLTHSHLKKIFSQDYARVHSLDLEWETISKESDKNPCSDARPDNLAYVIYTSGSTGRPNGIMVSHRSVCNHLQWRQSVCPLLESDGVLQKASMGFDISVWEIFAPLLAGVRLILAKPGREREPDYLVQLMAEEGISVAHFSPSPFRTFLEEPDLERCQALKSVFCGGETLSVAQMKRFFSRCQGDLYHQYGPTEACIDATIWQCSSVEHPNYLPIGKPIANVQVYILEPSLQPVPVGVSGEIYIGGICLARGYVARPDLTAETFVPHPFSPNPGMRLYRTGDRARYRADGALEFLGRVDHQVKLRGFRIELGEIEAVLSQHPDVQEAIVVLREDEPEDKRLVGYVVPTENPLSPNDLRQYMKQTVPDYMVPAHFVMLKALSVTTNGKVDRRALPMPDGNQGYLETDFVAPQTPTEQQVAEILQKVLGVEQVGMHDNFFELGGHSLLATQVLSRVRDVFGVNLKLRYFFEMPTIAGMAESIETLQWKTKAPLRVEGTSSPDRKRGRL